MKKVATPPPPRLPSQFWQGRGVQTSPFEKRGVQTPSPLLWFPESPGEQRTNQAPMPKSSNEPPAHPRPQQELVSPLEGNVID